MTKIQAVPLVTLSDYASITQEGKLSIVGIFDELRTQKLPAGLARAFLVTTVHGAPHTKYRVSAQLHQEGKKENILPPMNLEVTTGNNGRSNVIVELLNVSFPNEGVYMFEFLSEKDIIGSATLKVMEVKPDSRPSFLKPN